MLDNDKIEQIEQIEHRVQNAGLGYDTGTLARTYAKDVKALLDERKALIEHGKQALGVLETLPGGRTILRRGGAVYFSITEAEVEYVGFIDAANAGLGTSIESLRAQAVELTNKLTTANECADLWKRDCEAAQLRVRELENSLQTIGSSDATVTVSEPMEVVRK